MITDRERSLANLCSTRSRRELSNQVNFESMRAIPILTDGQTFAPRHYRASIDPVHGLRARERNANGQKIGGREKWQYLGEQCSFGILSRAGRTIPSNGPWGSIGRVWRRKSVGQEIKYYPRGARASFGCGNLGVSSVWRPPKERSRRGLRYVLPGAVPWVSGTNNILTRTRQTRNLCSLGAQCLISAPLKRTF